VRYCANFILPPAFVEASILFYMAVSYRPFLP